MKHPKQASSIYIALIAILLFAACEDDNKKFTIGVSQCSQDEWRNKMNMEMQHEALLYPDAVLKIKSVSDNTEAQIQDIEQFIADGVDLLIVTPNKAAPLTAIIEKAYNAGIPVVLVDRKILSDKYTAFVGADNYEIGKEVGNYAVALLKGKGNIAEMQGLEGSTSALERHQGFFSVISTYPNVHLVHREDAAWLKDIAENKMAKILNDNITIDLVYAQNDRMAQGAYNAAKQKGVEKNMKFIGIDGLSGPDEGIDMVLSGKLEGTFLYPTGGDKAIEIAMAILHKQPFEKNIELHTALVNKSNAKIIKLQTAEIGTLQKKMESLNKQIDNYLSKYAMQRNLLYLICSVVVLTILLLLWIFISYRGKNRLNKELSKRNEEINVQNLILEEQKKQMIHLSGKLEEATHAKLVFFTNISHEFKTPLTLIAGPIQTLLDGENISPDQKHLLTLMRKNVSILLNLINQIIEFRRIENGKHSLNLGKHNLADYLLDWNTSFAEASKAKGIDFSCEIKLDKSDYIMSIDLDKMERIYFNLLSNAIKYSFKNGYIRVILSRYESEKTSFAQLRVVNEGQGLSEEQIRNIFDRFYQVDSHAVGSGIGLALTKSFVELHGGTIATQSVDNEICFTVSIPFNNESGNDSTFIELEDSAFIGQNYFYETPLQNLELRENKVKMLVVDDNSDVRNYLYTILASNGYDVIEAGDGKEGLEKALNLPIDIVISDVIMPKIDGITLCRELKENPTTCHIPVILLTASSQEEERIKGFESGADAYIPKPFNPNMLVVRVRKILENRTKLINYFNNNLVQSEADTLVDVGIVINPMDESLINRFNTYVFSNITNPDLSVEEIARQLGFSRVQLYRKLKAITNHSPNELIRHIRLRFSQNLLNQGKTITEIAYESGFTSVSYYSKCYKDFFNETPSEFSGNNN